MKLYGKELDEELMKRENFKQQRINHRKTLKAKAKELNMSVLEYSEWERGLDICPHEKMSKSIGGFHKPYLLMEKCDKCGYINIIGKIETEEDCDKYKNDIEEALKHRDNC